MQTQEVPPGYDFVVLTKPKTKSVKRGMKERSKSGFRKITISKSGSKPVGLDRFGFGLGPFFFPSGLVVF